MKILMFSQFFPPEANAPAHRMGFFARFFAEQYQDKVTVICETPNYPRSEVFPGFKNKWFQRAEEQGITVIRSWAWVTKQRNTISYLLIYASFLISSFFAGLRAGRADVVFATSPPLPVLFSALVISFIRRIPLVVDIRDIWPESALAVGVLKKNLFYRVLEACERYVYRRARVVTVNAEGIGKRLHEGRGVPKEKIKFFPNGADMELFDGTADTSEIDKMYGTKDKFVVFFAGILGRAQDPQVIVEAANLIRDENNIAFVLVGSGALKGECEARTEELKLTNTFFVGERPREDMPKYFARANVGLNTLFPDPLFSDVISSKVFDYMAAGVPVIGNHEGEGARIITRAGCGLVAEGGSARSLADRILELFRDKTYAKKMGSKGKAYAAAHYDKRVIAQELHELLMRTSDRTRGRA
ncbi:MAG: glycosyltransferase family 4 protein [Candidatus Jorgensenbacteria bacterium]|nr:glycosyltransferase family 4 protein [Candidatus Jorgensenbacteria bacterium]